MTFPLFSLLLLSVLSAGAAQYAEPDYDGTFSNNGHSFFTSRNDEICASYTMTVTYNASVPDYGVYLTGLAALIAANTSVAGGAVVLGPGVFPVSTAVILPSNACLLGAGMYATTLRVVDGADDAAPFRGVLRSVNTSRVTLKHFTLDCNAARQNNTGNKEHFAKFGVFLEAANYTFVQSVRVRGALGYGFDPHGSAAGHAHHAALDGVVSEHARKDGIKFSGVTHGSVLRSISVASGRHGVRVTKGSQLVNVMRTLSVDAGWRQSADDEGCGIAVHAADGLWPNSVRVSDCAVHNARAAGVCLVEVVGVRVERTAVTHSRDDEVPCIRASDADGAVLVANPCGARQGFRVVRSSGHTPAPACTGKQTGDACCPAACAACGGDGCSALAPVGKCCVSDIADMNRDCRFDGPPCKM